MPAIHQLVAGFSSGDAISNEARTLRALFRSWGYSSEIYAEARRILPELRGEVRDLRLAPAEIATEDVVLLHLSIGSDANDIFPALRGRKAILYHNITPAEYFRGIQEQIARTLARGREQAARLADVAEVVLADSAYNAAELAVWGYRDVRVFPLALDFDFIGTPPDRATLRKYGDGRTNVLFVGRGAPNKRIEDVIAVFYYLQRYVDPNARFIHAGSYAGTERYQALLYTHLRDLRARDAELLGAVPQAVLSALYRTATVFLCMSEHEGFCIPLIEAMTHDTPVIAYAAAAVPETLGGAGVLVREKRFDRIAELIGELKRDSALREAVLRRQRERLARFRARNVESELRAHLAPLLRKESP